MTWPNGTAVEETIKALSAKLTATEARLAEAERERDDLRERLAAVCAERDELLDAPSTTGREDARHE